MSVNASKTLFRTIAGLLLCVAILGNFILFQTSGMSDGLRYSLLVTNILFIYLTVRYGTWRETTAFMLVYVVVAGFLVKIPEVQNVEESIRNQFFHVPMWIAMVILLMTSLANAIMYLSKGDIKKDLLSVQTAKAGILFGVLGIVTGMLWAKYTWGSAWHGDPKQIAAAIGLLVYFAYFILRESISDDVKKARISALYNIFAFPAFVALIYVVPRMVENTLHPGDSGNPGFSKYDLNDNMKLVYYPALLAWTMLGFWLADIGVRTQKIRLKKYEAI